MQARIPPGRRWTRLAAAALASLILLQAAGADEPPRADPLWIGTWPVTPEAVVDGDTVRLPAGMGSIRVLGLDCEEVFKDAAARAAAEQDFVAYAKAQRGARRLPVKYGTPAGETARGFAQQLAQGATAMRLERDALDAPVRGTYGRLLAHVILQGPQGPINLAEALIRAGHSPYFVKYGRSRRFDAIFRAAEAEARAAGRGIWGSTGPAHYPDYEERLGWWEARAQQVDQWQKEAARPDHVTLGAPDADERLGALVGKDAVVFGLLDRELEVKTKDKRVLLLTHLERRGFSLVFFDLTLPDQLDMHALTSRYLTVRGKVTLYNGRPQMIIESAAQISARQETGR